MKSYASEDYAEDTQNEMIWESGSHNNEDKGLKRKKKSKKKKKDKEPAPEEVRAVPSHTELIYLESSGSDIVLDDDSDSVVEDFDTLGEIPMDEKLRKKFYDLQVNYSEDAGVMDLLDKISSTGADRPDGGSSHERIREDNTIARNMDRLGSENDTGPGEQNNATAIVEETIKEIIKSGVISDEYIVGDLLGQPREPPPYFGSVETEGTLSRSPSARSRSENVLQVLQSAKETSTTMTGPVTDVFIADLSSSSSLTVKSGGKAERSRTPVDYTTLKYLSKEISAILREANEFIGKDKINEGPSTSSPKEKSDIGEDRKTEETLPISGAARVVPFGCSLRIGSRVEIEIIIEPNGDKGMGEISDGIEFRIKDKTFRLRDLIESPSDKTGKQDVRPESDTFRTTPRGVSRETLVGVLESENYAKGSSSVPLTYPVESKEPVIEVSKETILYKVSSVGIKEVRVGNRYVEYKNESDDPFIERPREKRMVLLLRIASPMRRIYGGLQRTFNLERSYSRVFNTAPCWVTLNPFSCGTGTDSDTLMDGLIPDATDERDPFQLYSEKSKFRFKNGRDCVTARNKCKFCRCIGWACSLNCGKPPLLYSSTEFPRSDPSFPDSRDLKIKLLDNKLSPPIKDKYGRPALILDSSGRPLFARNDPSNDYHNAERVSGNFRKERRSTSEVL